MPISDSLRCIFVHIPKTGGGTIEQLLNLRNFLVSNDLESTHLTFLQIPNLSIYQTYFKFSFVRHPLDRLVSEYFFSKLYRPYLPNTSSISFKEYVQRISLVNLEQRHYTINHLLPQWQFLYASNRRKLLVDKVYRFELFLESAYEICERFGVVVGEIPHENKSSHGFFMDYYDDETLRLAIQMYSEDFRLFGYSVKG